MFCPRCGQERVSQDTSFCSRCGFLLTGTAELLLMDGVTGSNSAISAIRKDSARRRGIKQGLFMILLTIVLAPVLGIIFRFGLNMIPWPMGVIVFLLGGGGLLRIVYALMFEARSGNEPRAPERILPGRQTNLGLPAGDASSYIPPTTVRSGRWRDTSDLEPRTVTEGTTKLLEKERD